MTKDRRELTFDGQGLLHRRDSRLARRDGLDGRDT